MAPTQILGQKTFLRWVLQDLCYRSSAMIVICEECGKKYRIDPSKIKGAAARFKCRVCTHMIMVSRPQAAPAAASTVDLSVTN
jgi:predicted Zn finger-like uncharacterized protein